MTNQRPYILCHMMQTIDGKIASGVADTEIIMDHFDTYTETEKEFDAKVWMFGRKTGGAFAVAQGTPLPAIDSIVGDSGYTADNSGDTYAVIVDTRGILRWAENFIHLSNQSSAFHLIMIVTKETPKEYLSYLQGKKISYVFGGESEVDFEEVLTKLRSTFNIQKVLLEGGGSLNGSLMAQGLVDEISVLLIPRVLNKKDAPALFDQQTSKVRTTDYSLSLAKELEGGVLWLRYTKK